MANNKIQVKRTSTAGRTPNTTNAGNTQYIAAGELALNMTDQIVYTSDGTNLITVGANLVNQRITNSLTLDNDKNLYFKTVNTSASVGMRQQTDDNFVFYSTNTVYGQRPVWSIYANSITSAFSVSVPTIFNGNVNLGQVSLTANGSTGTAGQVLTTNGSSTYWSTVSGSGSVNVNAQYVWSNLHTFSANISFGNNIAFGSGNGIYFNLISDGNWRIGRNTGGVGTKFFYTGNTMDIVAANSALEGIAFGYAGNSYLETGYAGTFTRNPIYVGNTVENVATTNTTIKIQTNTTVNSTMTAALVQVSNSTSTANLTALDLKIGATTTVNSIQVTATTLVGNLSGSYANITGQVNTATLYATTSANIASAVQANATGVYTTGTVNAASHTVGSSTVANSIGVYTGIVNAATHSVGTAFTANSTVVNAVAYYSGTLLVANSTVSNATHLGGYTWAAPPVLGSSTANGASLTYANVSGQVNTVTLYVTTSANVGANVQLTTSQLFVGNATVNSTYTSALVQVSNSTATANLTATSLNIYANSTVNGSFTSTTVSVANSTGNVQTVPTSLTVQNSTVNSVMGLQSLLIQANTTVNGSITQALVQIANSTGNVQHSAISILAQTNTTVNSTHTASLLQVANSTSTANLTALDLKIGATTTVNSTQVTATTLVGNVSGSYANVSGQVNAASLLLSNSGAAITLTNTTSGWVSFPTGSGYGPPTNTTSSVGTKILLYPGVTATQSDFAIGIESFGMWHSVPINTATYQFKWYANTAQLMSLNGAGALSVNGSVNAASLTLSTNVATIGTGSYFVSNGNVGIGTSSPATKLHLSDTGPVYIMMIDQGDGAGRIGQNGTALTLGVDATNGATERMRIDASGNVGIGNTAPNAKLQVTGTANISGNVGIGTTIAVNGSIGTAGQVLTSGAGTNAYWSTASGGAKGGGSDAIFFENDQIVTTNYTITTNKNAITGGPITINSGISVTIPTGSVWTIL